MFMHLTNYAINKVSDKFEKNTGGDNDDCGHKRSLTFAMRYIEACGFDSKQVLHNMKEVIIKCLCAAQPMLAHTYRSCQPDDLDNSMCFEILGFDLFLDDKLKPWILEVNHAPSFSTDSPLDFKIKKALIHETIRLLMLSNQRKNKYKKLKAQEFQKRQLKGKVLYSREEKQKLREKAERKREKAEHKLLSNAENNNFELIFPSEEFKPAEFQKFIVAAKEIYDDKTGNTTREQREQRESITSTAAETLDSNAKQKLNSLSAVKGKPAIIKPNERL
jgi:tubulin polyglutamylase TTLL6/13